MTTMNDINKEFTAIVSNYMADGWMLNAPTMGGSQGELAHIDLTKDGKFIRAYVERFSNWDTFRGSVDGVRIVVGYCVDEKVLAGAKYGYDYYTVWNQYIEVTDTREYYQLGVNRDTGLRIYGTKEEAYETMEKRWNRRSARRGNKPELEDVTDKTVDAILPVVQRVFSVKRANKSLVKVKKYGNSYTVTYRNKSYTLK